MKVGGAAIIYVEGFKLAGFVSAGKMLGQVLVTKQTGAEGKPVNKVTIRPLDGGL